MTLRRNRNSRFGKYVSPEGFSSLSLGSYSGPKLSSASGPYHAVPVTPVTFNKSLLTPLKFDIDPSFHAARTQEKDDIKRLNNRFASFIDKVRFLEQQNKMLETKWELLQQQKTDPSDVEPILKSYIANLQKQLNALTRNKERLALEGTALQQSVNDYKMKYEDEINKRNWAENDFVMLKQDLDSIYLSRVCLEEKVTTLAEEINFRHAVYDMELSELQDSLKETSVVVQMDNSRDLNMDHIVSEVKAQYEEIAARSREESESLYKTKYNQISAQADQYSSELHSAKGDISEVTRLISRLQKEIQAVKGQQTNVESHISEVEAQGEQSMKDTEARIKDLEEALSKAKQDMARQLIDYQELMNIKLALDIEISTYRKLLEGEEERIGQQPVVNIQAVPSRSVAVDSNQKSKLAAIVIKKVENFGSVISYN